MGLAWCFLPSPTPHGQPTSEQKMTYSDRQILNPPIHWHNDDLRLLHTRLMAYEGQDRFDHPFRQGTPQDIGACVLVLITNESCPRLLLTKRSRHLSSHKGEVAFVGGHRDQSDQSTAHTALREGFEEVGLPTNAVHIIGYLPIQTAKSGKAVRPVVGVIDAQHTQALMGAEDEIERIFWGRLSDFCNTPPTDFCLNYDNRKLQTLAWHIDGEAVWGLTGRIIANLLEIGYGQKMTWYYKIIT